MQKEILEITPAGGIYCLVSLPKPAAKTHDFSKPHGYPIQDLLNQIRLNENPGNSFLTDGDILRWGLAHLCQTPLGRSLAHDARFDDWMIAIEDGDEWSEKAQADSELKCLYLPRYSDSIATFSRSQNAQMQFLFHLLKGLRLIWQGNMDIKKIDHLGAEDFVRYARVVEADGDLCSILTAYQLRETGDHDMWRYILSSDLSGIAATLCECLDFDASADGVLETLGFIFQDWFAEDSRLNRIDHESLTQLDDRHQEHENVTSLDFEDLIQMSMLPEGFSYLDYTAADILTDAYYARMPDPTNRAHLNQILAEVQIGMADNIGFRDTELARKFFPMSTFETVV